MCRTWATPRPPTADAVGYILSPLRGSGSGRLSLTGYTRGSRAAARPRSHTARPSPRGGSSQADHVDEVDLRVRRPGGRGDGQAAVADVDRYQPVDPPGPRRRRGVEGEHALDVNPD